MKKKNKGRTGKITYFYEGKDKGKTEKQYPYSN